MEDVTGRVVAEQWSRELDHDLMATGYGWVKVDGVTYHRWAVGGVSRVVARTMFQLIHPQEDMCEWRCRGDEWTELDDLLWLRYGVLIDRHHWWYEEECGGDDVMLSWFGTLLLAQRRGQLTGKKHKVYKRGGTYHILRTNTPYGSKKGWR